MHFLMYLAIEYCRTLHFLYQVISQASKACSSWDTAPSLKASLPEDGSKNSQSQRK